jgi:predicted nucleic acid-binding Zn ribbon protein
MIYTFECSCGATRQENISVEARDTTVVTCSTCNAAMRRIFNAGKVNIAMKGWGWTGRDYKEKRSRDQHSIDMALKQQERYGDGPRLVPNYKGKEADTWDQVRDQAITDNGVAAASQYSDLIAREQHVTTRSEVVEKTIKEMKGL